MTSVAAGGRIPVFQLLTNFKVGGTERHVTTLARLLDPARFEMHLGCFGRFGEFLEPVERFCSAISEYPIHRLPAPSTLRRQAQLARDLRRKRIAVFHAYGFWANVFGLPAARWAGVPVVLASIRDTGDHLSASRRRLQKLVCRLADAVLVNAAAVRHRLLLDGFPAGKLAVIQNGTSVDAAGPATGLEERRRALGLPELGPLVTVVSRLNPMKGIEYFLEAAHRVSERIPDARFLVVGECASAPGFRAQLEAIAARHGLGSRVHFLGFRSDVSELLAASTVSVLPSLSEGLSNVLLESMAAGVPVVATRVGGNPEVVEHGVTGLLVPPADAAGLAQAITLLLEHPHLATCYGQAARERVRERFSDARMVRETEALYLAWLARKGFPAVPQALRERTA